MLVRVCKSEVAGEALLYRGRHCLASLKMKRLVIDAVIFFEEFCLNAEISL